MVKSIEFESLRDLPVRLTHSLGNMRLIDRTQCSDLLARPSARTGKRALPSESALAGIPETLAEAFSYTPRGELASASLNGREFRYVYDNIGNRSTALEPDRQTDYAANHLNQYDSIALGQATPFLPEYDADGSQTALRTSAGDWRVEYDTSNRPVRFSRPGTEVHCEYDSKGRRFSRKILKNGQTVSHLRYLYRGYLQIAALDLLDNGKLLHTLLWAPTEETATRPLAMIKNGEAYYYAHDFNKNVTELLDDQGAIRAAYDYTSFGAVTIHDPDALDNPVQWSSEMHDEELRLVYYNYRHYNPLDGRWISRDLIHEQGGLNLYSYLHNKASYTIDNIGLVECGIGAIINGKIGIPPIPKNTNINSSIYNFTCDSPKQACHWLSGSDEKITNYPESSEESKNMSQSAIAKKLINYFYNKNRKSKCCEDWVGVDNFSGNFSVPEFFSDFIYLNGTAHFVGSARGDVSVKIENSYVIATYTFTNPTHIKSLLYHIPGTEYLEIKKPEFPCTTWKQTYTWSEKIERRKNDFSYKKIRITYTFIIMCNTNFMRRSIWIYKEKNKI